MLQSNDYIKERANDNFLIINFIFLVIKILISLILELLHIHNNSTKMIKVISYTVHILDTSA